MPHADREVDVLIAGAGIAGLAAALNLHRVGITCGIVEAASEFRPIGVGLTILPHAAQQLGVLGLEHQLAAGSVLTKEEAFFNRFGQLIYREAAGRYAGYRDPQYSIPRAHLHNVLLDAVAERLGPGIIKMARQVLGFDQHADSVRVHVATRDGGRETYTAGVLVAADGIRSAIRAQLFPDEGPPRYSGVTMWRGTTVWRPFLSGASMVRVGSLKTGQLVCYPIRDDVAEQGRQLINWVVELEADQRPDRGWTHEGVLSDFVERFADWHFDWLDVPEMMKAFDTLLEYPMVDRAPLDRWSEDRVTLVGDAAHPMVPRGSNGAAQAILDARKLADCLAEHVRDPSGALQAYEADRRPATAAVIEANKTHSPDRILRLIYERTGDRPFRDISDVATSQELAQICQDYREVAGYSREALTQPAAT